MTIRLAAGDVSAGVDPAAGGRLASLVVGGRERLVTSEDPTALLPSITWGSFAMLPWVGRMRGGRLAWRGTDVRLPLDFGAHAIHGATYDRAWEVVGRDDTSVELELAIGPSGRWPFAALARQRIALEADALAQTVEVAAAEPMPVSVGWHPWFRRGPGEPVRVLVPAPAVLETAPDMIPTGTVVPVDERTDLRGGPLLGERRLDDAYVDVAGPCSIAWPDLELTVAADPLVSVVVYSPPHAVCLEPQTAWPDAVRLAGAGLPSGLSEIGAGETFRAWTRWSWRTLATA